MYRIGDFLIKLKNAYMASKRDMEYPYSNAVLSIGKILEKEGYIKKIKEEKSKVANGKGKLAIELLYKNRLPAISELKLVSRPSIHRFAGHDAVLGAAAKHGIAVVSTSRGMMTNKEAKKLGIGGEIICQIY